MRGFGIDATLCSNGKLSANCKIGLARNGLRASIPCAPAITSTPLMSQPLI